MTTGKTLFFRGCALSCIGMVDPENNYDFLVEKYNQADGFDRFMALKSIGDCETEKSKSFVKDASNDKMYNNEIGFQKCVDLFTL